MGRDGGRHRHTLGAAARGAGVGGGEERGKQAGALRPRELQSLAEGPSGKGASRDSRRPTFPHLYGNRRLSFSPPPMPENGKAAARRKGGAVGRTDWAGTEAMNGSKLHALVQERVRESVGWQPLGMASLPSNQKRLVEPVQESLRNFCLLTARERNTRATRAGLFLFGATGTWYRSSFSHRYLTVLIASTTQFQA